MAYGGLSMKVKRFLAAFLAAAMTFSSAVSDTAFASDASLLYSENFSEEDMVSAIKSLKTLGVKSNITMNTQLYEGELWDALRDAERVINAGADAIITADLGLASLIKKYFPKI